MIDLAALPIASLGVTAGVLGLIVGSFLNVVIHRLPRGESIVRPRSRCPSCERQITALENVPVLSWLWLRGRCRGCGTGISLRYPAIELVTGVLFAAIVMRHGAVAMTPAWLLLAAALIASSVIDFDHHIIPDEISLGGLLLAIACVPGLQTLAGGAFSAALGRSLAGAALGGGVLWLVGFAHARYCVASGRRFEHWPGAGERPPTPSSLDYWTWFPGLGFGDVKLLAMVGAVVGPLGVMETLVAASLAGLVLGVGWAVVTRRWNAPFGFGPAIAAGALLVILAPADFLGLTG